MSWDYWAPFAAYLHQAKQQLHKMKYGNNKTNVTLSQSTLANNGHLLHSKETSETTEAAI